MTTRPSAGKENVRFHSPAVRLQKKSTHLTDINHQPQHTTEAYSKPCIITSLSRLTRILSKSTIDTPTMPGDYTRCPFSYAMFIGTAALFAYLHEKKKKSKALPSAALAVCEVVFVLGGPGAGKGTQCQLLQERQQGWVHLSAGDLLRAERQAGGELGDMINAKIANGELVPSSITVKCLEKAMVEAFAMNQTTKFLIDGFPRSHENLSAWEDIMKKHSLKFVLNFECPEEVLVGRLLERGQSSGRSDDKIEVIRKRLQTFQKESQPMVKHYEQVGVKVHKIPSDSTVEQVYTKVAALF
jgi:UMP-CMP kinase